jgi:hypoxanthine-DNA glycosylase
MKQSGLGPIINRSARILILGSFPGPTALRRRQYYAYPQNRFWPIVASISGKAEAPKDYREKTALLSKAGIGLWDVVSTCERNGAGDSNIKHETPNDIPAFLKRYSNIRTIFFNGKKAEQLFRKHFKIDIHTLCLPSTSPANASIPDARKLSIWKNVIGRA